jgi:hypothetical protein
MKLSTVLGPAMGLTLLGSAILLPVNADAQWNAYSHRQQTKNEWRNLAYGAGALGILGLINNNGPLTLLGAAGAGYSAYRYEQDRRSQRAMRDGNYAYSYPRYRGYRNYGYSYPRHRSRSRYYSSYSTPYYENRYYGGAPSYYSDYSTPSYGNRYYGSTPYYYTPGAGYYADQYYDNSYSDQSYTYTTRYYNHRRHHDNGRHRGWYKHRHRHGC